MSNQVPEIPTNPRIRVSKPHPWHGVRIGPQAPALVNVYIEIVPTDTVKFEMDKETGYLRVDRPQLFSNFCPTLYGFMPQTYSAENVARYCMDRTQLKGVQGDGDPLDICVVTEKDFSHGDILLRAIPIGGLRLLDEGTVDDKIIAVLQGDAVYGAWRDISECPEMLLDRWKHYFLTYKDVPGSRTRKCEIMGVYGRQEAHEVIEQSRRDYRAHFGDFEAYLESLQPLQ